MWLYVPVKIDALLGPHIELVANVLFSIAPSSAILSIFGVGAISLYNPPYAEIALVV